MPAEDDLADFEHELKFLLPRARVPAAAALLASLCRPDARFPANYVCSLYYDTRALELLQDKIDSQRCKAKVRLRWYESGSAGKGDDQAFLEVKRRVGTLRHKTRIPAPLGAGWLRTAPLQHRALAGLPARLPFEAFRARERLLPYLTVRYHRRRLFDPLSRSRISIDTGIGVQRVNPLLLGHGRPGVLEVAVIEVKNRSGALPVHLRSLLRAGCLQSSFSKYASCFETTLSSQPPII